ncbi:hypothetical protein FHETE_5768 [Fusarium heterosporum]|uniref:Uncharacterized protein n=1 Tax=Fusarium heterosporum TaxID=42747 RepID=A0A8H5TD60_FUSHE|nr:hypothetical protein FHETE_5768 [Fusarium heterosporum]
MLLKTLLLAITATPVFATNPIGGGRWKKVDPVSNPQQCAGASIRGDYYILPNRPNGSTEGSGCKNGHLRAEQSVKNHYTNGVHQFTGKFKIHSFGGDGISLKQTFHGDQGAWHMIAVKKDGMLYSVGGGAKGVIANGVAKVGSTVTINTIHDLEARTFKVYVNGQQKYASSSPGGTFGDKYGAYATVTGTGPINVEWTDVEYYTR